MEPEPIIESMVETQERHLIGSKGSKLVRKRLVELSEEDIAAAKEVEKKMFEQQVAIGAVPAGSHKYDHGDDHAGHGSDSDDEADSHGVEAAAADTSTESPADSL